MDMTKTMSRYLVALLGIFMVSTAYAKPPLWDADYGTNIGLNEDDGTASMALGFDFPIGGNTYNYIAINTNGGVAFGNADTYAGDDYVDYDIWNDSYFESDFSAVGNPMILVFNSDLDGGSQGDLFFKSDGASATVTWLNWPSYATDSEPFLSFQLRIDANGTIVLGYDELQNDLSADLDQGIVVGVSDGSGETPPGSVDLSLFAGESSGSNPNLYEIWCYEGDAASCFEPSQPDQTNFDLENSNVIITPNDQGGFDSEVRTTLLNPGDGGGSFGLGALVLLGLAGFARRRGK